MGIAKIGRCLAGGVAAGLLLTACGNSGTPSAGGALPSIAPVKTGYQLAYLGDVSGSGDRGGIELALADYAKQHPNGPKVTFVYEDDQGNAAPAVPLAYAIVQDPSVIGLVGPDYSSEAAAVNPIFNRADLSEISPSATNATLTRTGWKTFHRLVANDSAQGAAGAAYLRHAGKKRVFLVDDSESYGTGLVGYVRDGLGKAVVGSDSIQVGQKDFSGTVAKVTAAHADALYFGGSYTEAGLLLKQLRAAGWKGQFMSGDGSEDPHFVTYAGASAANGAVLTNAAGPASASFVSAYEAANKGQVPSSTAVQAFDATNIYLQGILAGDTTRAKMQAFVSAYSGTGAEGPIRFDADGDIEQSAIWAYHVVDGKLDVSHPTRIQ